MLLAKGEGLWKIFIDFLLKQCCFCMGTRLKEYSYRSQNNLLDFTRRALRDLYCSNASRNSSKFSQKCTLPCLYSHCWKTLPLGDQHLGSRCMWTRDIWRGTVSTVICSRTPSHLCSVISHSGPLCCVGSSSLLNCIIAPNFLP